MIRGRPGDVTPQQIRRIRQLRSRGLSFGQIAVRTEVPKSTVRYHADYVNVLNERKHLRDSRPKMRINTCTGCGEPDHNVRTCKKRKQAA